MKLTRKELNMENQSRLNPQSLQFQQKSDPEQHILTEQTLLMDLELLDLPITHDQGLQRLML